MHNSKGWPSSHTSSSGTHLPGSSPQGYTTGLVLFKGATHPPPPRLEQYPVSRYTSLFHMAHWYTGQGSFPFTLAGIPLYTVINSNSLPHYPHTCPPPPSSLQKILGSDCLDQQNPQFTLQLRPQNLGTGICRYERPTAQQHCLAEHLEHRYRTYGDRIGNGRGIYTFLCDDPCCAAICKCRHYTL